MRTTHHDEDAGPSLATRLTVGVLLWNATKGFVRLAAMAGAAVLGWRLVRRMFDQASTSKIQTVSG